MGANARPSLNETLTLTYSHSQSEAARDLAQLKLAEQIIQEKERHIQEEEYRVDIVVMEKEALVEELVHVRSHKSLQSLTREEAVKSPTAGKVCQCTLHCTVGVMNLIMSETTTTQLLAPSLSVRVY